MVLLPSPPISTPPLSSSSFLPSPLSSTATTSAAAAASASSLSLPLLSPKLRFFPSPPPPPKLRSTAPPRRRSASCPCSRRLSSFNPRAMAGLVKDKEVAASVSDSRTFLDATTEEELLSGIRKAAEAGTLSSNVAMGMKELYQNYKTAVLQSGVPNANEIIVSNMAVALDRIFLDAKDPFVFSPHHKALREPFDYYEFGQNYIRPLIDFRNSYVGNISLFKEIEKQLQQGHNVVLISNHQTEADPAIIALLLEKTNPYISENLIYVAGDRVVTDPLSKPFSMGRNLICVYSKKHMHDDPELVDMKKKANIRSLKEMAVLLRGGSQIVWIAPSGGRDRPDPTTGEWYPAPFDASSVDNMRRLAAHSGAPGHLYPLGLLCHDIMPPPPQVEKEIGEKRVIAFSGAGLSVGQEISFAEVTATYENQEEAKEVYAQRLYNSVTEQYNVLKSAIHGKQGPEASTPAVSLSQAWN
ncbi:Glycerol-3-phosphate dehydrogenase [NAD(+)] [Turnera subulata]|uniref:Glycerol-3-phosphate acyltransferase, chloroplastic n=1 Tax=Turnera subulata TaxID=218843 RepID=A0A9Q0JCP2_9ROSI|nr:Glycerol-3-phosphate dehydrogenase [NAD(+)] [Turnera subulata]